MKLAFVFLLALVVVSQQQYHRPRTLWYSPYLQQPAFNPIQPYHYNYVEGVPSFRYYTPSRPAIYSQEDAELNTSLAPVDNENEEQEDYPDVQSRYKSSYLQNQQNKARLFFNYGTSTSVTNLLFKTATFTLTSTVSLTSIISCIPSTQFAAGSANVVCRRKRNQIPLFDQHETVQFSIEPSETQKVTTTGLPSLAEVREGRQSTIDEASHHDLVSSIDDEERVVMPKPSVSEYLRNKRFYFNYFLTSTTVTSYTFVSTTVTKTVNLLPSPTVSPNLLQCRPSGFAVCA